MHMSKNRVIVVTDTTACLPNELTTQLEVEVVPVVFVFGKESFRDGIDMTNAQFYEKLRLADRLPTTSGGLTAPYLEAFTRAAKKGDSVLCLNLSSKLSAMTNSARMARELAASTLPCLRIEVLDTGTAAGAQGLIVTAAARAAQSGSNLSEAVKIVKDVMPKVHLFAMLDTLHYLVKGGRAPKAAEIASFLQVKPIIGVIDGIAKPVENCITAQKAMQRLVQIVEEKVVKGAPLHLVAMHAGAPERGQKLLNMLNKKFQPVECALWEFTPVMGVHTGPGLVGVAFYSE
jgi:DegV family protein with EDD domain